MDRKEILRRVEENRCSNLPCLIEHGGKGPGEKLARARRWREGATIGAIRVGRRYCPMGEKGQVIFRYR